MHAFHFHDAHETMDEYLARTDMHSSSVWAMEVEIFAVSNMLRTPITVFCQSGHSYKWLHFLPHPCEDSNVVHEHSKELSYTCMQQIAMILILNSQRPFLTTWYTFGKGGTLFATNANCTGWYNFGCENCTWWYLLFQLGKKRGGGDLIFQRGTDFFRKYWSLRTIFF